MEFASLIPFKEPSGDSHCVKVMVTFIMENRTAALHRVAVENNLPLGRICNTLRREWWACHICLTGVG